MRSHRLALLTTVCLLASVMLISTGCRGKKPSWLSPWKKDTTEIPPPPLDGSNTWEQDLPGGFELPMMDPSQLPPLDVIEDRGIALAENPREAVQPVSSLQPIFFGYDSAGLSTEAQNILNSNAEWLKQNADVSVQIEGHCDDRGTVEYNFSLGQRRADAVREYLASRGIHPGRLVTISYGEERPLSGGGGESTMARNRRVQFMAY